MTRVRCSKPVARSKFAAKPSTMISTPDLPPVRAHNENPIPQQHRRRVRENSNLMPLPRFQTQDVHRLGACDAYPLPYQPTALSKCHIPNPTVAAIPQLHSAYSYLQRPRCDILVSIHVSQHSVARHRSWESTWRAVVCGIVVVVVVGAGSPRRRRRRRALLVSVGRDQW